MPDAPDSVRRLIRPCDIPADVAQKIARIGMFPLNRRCPIGEIILIGEQPFVVTGEATVEEFHATVEREGLATQYRDTPPGFFILRVTTD